MHKLFLIIQREYLYRVKKKSFFLLTLLTPLLLLGIAVVPFLLGQIQDNEQKKIVLVDKTGQYAPLFQDNSTYRFVTSPIIPYGYTSPSSDIEAVVAITASLADHPDSIALYSRKAITPELLRFVRVTLEEKVKQERLAKYDISDIDTIISAASQPLMPATFIFDEEGASETNTEASTVVGMGFALLIYTFILLYGSMVMQSAIEEKANRIVEIIISSVKPFQLMMGKIIGIGLVGLTQFALWGLLLLLGLSAFGLLFSTAEIATTAVGAMERVATTEAPTLPESAALLAAINKSIAGIPLVEVLLMFVLYFIGAFFLYSSFFAAVGASVNEQQDAVQFQTPMILVMVFSLYASMASAQNPDGPLAFWASFFPLTAPVVMMVRIPFSVPLWQELLSLAILYATAFGFIWTSGRIYRVGVLMYGKKPTFKELFKWITYQ